MVTITASNVNEALPIGIDLLNLNGEEIIVRGLRTIEYPEPVATLYTFPWQRMLFNPIRDANPFFHVMESLWILAGRNDVEFPSRFNANLKQYSDDGEIYHGAYGHRLRACGVDQIKVAIEKLKADPTTRQVVLQIWDFNKDLGTVSKDIPCNDLIFCKIRDNMLNITVCCRSNDIIWGCYGANAVQFSYLQEYMAAMIGCGIGFYTQISDSFHAYPDNPQWEKLLDIPANNGEYPYEWYELVDDPDTFDDELQSFVQLDWLKTWNNQFFPEVAIPVWNAWYYHKAAKTGWEHAQLIQDEAIKAACLQWLARRGDEPTQVG